MENVNLARRYLRVPEASHYTGLSEATIRKWIFIKRLPSVRLGRAVLIPLEALEKMIEENYQPAEV
ncbi:helix-turn-helix domain-containing protein [Candidatus Manganitrophus noduliformans]|uniref:Helix-turn-helix domain-containing protein n=1 Tax=Candidatus Manganitrophus noduliformans TaxID=2606439 RepID=A0A7X6IBC1_9BACT|nr:helix-turn-helix domain-containing protein [Candidatus Manganitrophus noduliformans]NKE71259.1 helix-turn-helix domain-containing protein [Candidatus Manganitrophus noduliformans]